MSTWPDYTSRQRDPNPYPVSDPTEAAAGYSGSTTPPSVTNATTQQRSGGGSNDNPFTGVLDHVSTINNAFSGSSGSGPIPFSGSSYGSPLPWTATPQSSSGGDGPTQQVPDGTTGGGSGGGGTTPPPGNEPPPGTTPPPATTGGRGRATTTPTPHNDWLHYDTTTGTPWSITHPPPNPGGTEDPEVAARWYSQFNFLDSSLVNVTAADVQAFRTSGFNPTEQQLASQPGMFRSAFLAWWQNGKPTPAQTPPPTTTPITSNWTPGMATGGVLPPATPGDPNAARIGAAAASGGAAPPGPPAGSGPSTLPGRETPPPPADTIHPAPPPEQPLVQSAPTPPPGSTPPPGTTPPPTSPPSSTDEITRLIDLFNSGKGPQQPNIEDMLNPLFARQRQLVADEMRAGYAAEGVHSGGANYNIDQAVSNLSGQQSATMAGEMGQEYLAKINQNTQLTQLATQAGMQKYVTDVNNDLERYKVVTNADLQNMLADKNNAFAKYGIDSNDVLQRYLGKLGIDKANIDAKATVDSAALHAAAAEAAAGASSAAAAMNANVNLQLGTGHLQVDREKNIGDFILGLLGLGYKGLGDLSNIFNNFPPGAFVVKP